MIAAILLVPNAEYREALIGDGVCGARPPRAWFSIRQGVAPKPCPVCGSELRWSYSPTEQSDSEWVCRQDWRHAFEQDAVVHRAWQAHGQFGDECALVLAWVRKLAPDGIDRLRRAQRAGIGQLSDRHFSEILDGSVRWTHSAAGRVVLLGADGQEITP